MKQIKISAKNLGQVALNDFCPRCFWIKLKTANKLPWQIFPGIFSSLDAYQKKAVHHIIDSKSGLPAWLDIMGPIEAYDKTPHWSKFKADFDEFGITLNGTMDDVFKLKTGTYVIPDYKTAKYTANQDKLLPMYQIQLNGYKEISEKASIYTPIEKLFLVYFEPFTDSAEGMTHEDGFEMSFHAKTVPMEIDQNKLYAAMEKTRKIYELLWPPDGKEGCKDCMALDAITWIFQEELL